MEPTCFQIEAADYRQKWQAAIREIERLRSKIAETEKELTDLRRENYKLLDQTNDRS